MSTEATEQRVVTIRQTCGWCGGTGKLNRLGECWHCDARGFKDLIVRGVVLAVETVEEHRFNNRIEAARSS